LYAPGLSCNALASPKYPRKNGTILRAGSTSPVGNENAVLLEVREQISPAWDRFGNTEPQKGKGHFSEDILGNENRGLGQKDTGGFGKNVAAEEVKVGGSEPSGGADEVSLFWR